MNVQGEVRAGSAHGFHIEDLLSLDVHEWKHEERCIGQMIATNNLTNKLIEGTLMSVFVLLSFGSLCCVVNAGMELFPARVR